jgi:hypothetical protein
MAQDPETGGDQPEVDVSHDFDMVSLYSSQTVDAEMEADVIHGILESNGIPSMVVRGGPYPILGFEVQVPCARLEEARRLIAEAQAAGPDAADEAEAASEEGQ